MQWVYNSDSFAVMHFGPVEDLTRPPAAGDPVAPASSGFEIVDKSSRKGIYLHGALAERFRREVQALAEQGPDVEALDACIAGYTEMAQQPLMLH